VKSSKIAIGIGTLGLAVPSCAIAQEFQIFDHDMGSVESAPDRRADVQHDPRSQKSQIDRSFKEALYEPPRELGVTNRHDPAQNIDGGARYLRQMLDQFGAIHLALAAYNAGPGAVSRAGGIPKNRETPGYVRNVIRRWMAYAKQ